MAGARDAKRKRPGKAVPTDPPTGTPTGGGGNGGGKKPPPKPAKSPTNTGLDPAYTGIDPDLPLPGSYTFQRAVRLNVTLPDGSTLKLKAAPKPVFVPWLETLTAEEIDVRAARAIWFRIAMAAGFTSEDLAHLSVNVDRERADDEMPAKLDVSSRQQLASTLLRQFEDGLLSVPREIRLPRLGGGGHPLLRPLILFWPPRKPPEGSLYLIQTFTVSSFAGRYGVGRTVKTQTLMPGEQVSLRLRSWRSTSSSKATSSSIMDSVDSSSSQRFEDSVEREAGSKTTANSDERGYVEAEVGGGIGIIHGDVKGGYEGKFQHGSEDFARGMSNAAREHASESSASRQTNVSSSSEHTDESGEENITERVIKNVNLRRTLNFVVRELNQEFRTLVHLRDIRVAYTAGALGTWREAPLSELRELLLDVVVVQNPAQLEQTVRDASSLILSHAAIARDVDDGLVGALEVMDRANNWDPVPVPPGANVQPATVDRAYRFRRNVDKAATTSNERDALDQAQRPRVAGILVKEDAVVLRTDSVVTEALVGAQEALDPFALRVQDADAEQRELQNDRERLAQQIADSGDAQTAAAFRAVFIPPPACCCEDETDA